MILLAGSYTLVCFSKTAYASKNHMMIYNRVDTNISADCRIISKVSWTIFYGIAKDKDGFVSKENMRRLFDGSLFEKLAKDYQTGVDKKMDDIHTKF